MGPLITKVHRDKVASYIDVARADGATVVVDGRDIKVDGDANGFWLGPTLIDKVPTSSAVYKDEIFGPVATVVPFSSDEEALALANDSVYGLAASVWTRDLNKAHKFVRELEAGVVWVNCFGDGDMTQPFGGYKQSGNSRDKHMMSLQSYLQTKSAWFQTG
jgi:gamma-glutamyl-gamma-aminobutyraldehyde dehydrogenase